MKKLALGALCLGFAVAACGGGDDGPSDDLDDIGDVTPGVDAPDNLTMGTCDPLTQDPCKANERCTWIWDSLDNPTTEMREPSVGHLGCAFDGPVAVSGQCIRSGTDFSMTDPPGVAGTGPSVPDNCERGTYCIAGTCKSICDNAGGDPACGTGFSCNRYSGIFVSMGMTVAGVCDPKCNPLTQETETGSLTACNSLDPVNPNTACFTTAGRAGEAIGFSCARVPAEAKGRTDRMAAYGPESGGAYANGCEAGYLPFYLDADDSTITNCHGVCAPADSDNSTAATQTAAIGDATKLAKLHDQPAPRVGDGVCQVGKKGSIGASQCRYLWTSNFDDMEMVIQSPFNDIIGTCLPYSDFTYNHDGMAVGPDGNPTPEIPYPSCAELPPAGGNAMSTIHNATADEFGCYSLARTEALPPPPRPAKTVKAISKLRMVNSTAGQITYRHVLL